MKETDKYILRKISNDLLFYVDRAKTKRFWWSYDLKYAMIFTSKDAANSIKSKLNFGQFEVITLEDAKSLRLQKNENHKLMIASKELYEDHPFSSDALGQW